MGRFGAAAEARAGLQQGHEIIQQRGQLDWLQQHRFNQKRRMHLWRQRQIGFDQSLNVIGRQPRTLPRDRLL
ncbi:MAG: hypothetical protein ABSH22_02910 [Tepidisphaeraceae bacterium]